MRRITVLALFLLAFFSGLAQAADFTDSLGRTVTQLATDPQWLEVPAVAAGRVYAVPSRPWGWLGTPPSVNRLIGLEWLSGLLYPQQPKRDLAADVRAFYRSYYQLSLTDAQLQPLLAP